MAPESASYPAVEALRKALGADTDGTPSLRSEAGAAAAREAAKALFAHVSGTSAAQGLDLPLPELHTAGLDAEQVWMQIEMQMAPLLSKAKTALRRLRPALEAGDGLAHDRLLRLPAGAAGGDEDTEGGCSGRASTTRLRRTGTSGTRARRRVTWMMMMTRRRRRRRREMSLTTMLDAKN